MCRFFMKYTFHIYNLQDTEIKNGKQEEFENVDLYYFDIPIVTSPSPPILPRSRWLIEPQ